MTQGKVYRIQKFPLKNLNSQKSRKKSIKDQQLKVQIKIGREAPWNSIKLNFGKPPFFISEVKCKKNRTFFIRKI